MKRINSSQKKKFVYVRKDEFEKAAAAAIEASKPPKKFYTVPKADKPVLLQADTVLLALRRDPRILNALSECEDNAVISKFLKELGTRAYSQITLHEETLHLVCSAFSLMYIDYMIYVFQCLKIKKIALKVYKKENKFPYETKAHILTIATP